MTAPYYFSESLRDPAFVTWSVDRQVFDQILLDHAVECGAKVIHGAHVSHMLHQGNRIIGVRYRTEGSASLEVRAPFVIDASGRAAFLSRKLGLRRRDPRLDQVAVWRYIKGAYR